MSRFSTSPFHPSAPPFDEAVEARALQAFLGDQDAVELQAAQWHTRQEQGLNADEQAELAQWLQASADHAEAFAGIDTGVARLRGLPADEVAQWRARQAAAQPSAAATSHKPLAQPTPTRPRPWLQALLPGPRGLALCAVLLMGLGLGWHQWMQPVYSAHYVVERGQRQSLQLPDGSTLELDADTDAQVRLYRHRREVQLAHGQAMFSVAPDSSKPFEVQAGPARVTVVGTRFSVRYRQDGIDAGQVRVDVQEGRVRVSAAQSSATAMLLTAGQTTQVAADGQLAAVGTVAPDSVGLWRKGLLRFDNTPLAQALQEMERYGPTGLVVHDPAVAALLIGGSYATAKPAEFANMLTLVLPVRLVPGAGGQAEIVAKH
ncbi:FecR domain-containing protein [Comamonas piscis]|uniref:FecR domain-containing protein n=1 Tax=Comamonas piscis TaxID=1562974 RepID=A0A7G5ELC8_9BURK|nr:FecR domain-containing protein [Comamonas piscis]QMV74803.1 FecR domain-containing protein [Comamonas piscis]WSO33274.1 FecR domain-containing protein [Comamonas piscis]